MNDLETRIKEVLSQALPAMQVESVVSQLQHCKELEVNVKQLQENLVTKEKRIASLEASVNELSKVKDEYESRESDLLAREAEVKAKNLDIETRERNIKLELANLRLELEVKRNDDLFNLTSQVFRSPVIHQSGQMSVIDSFGNYRNMPFEQTTMQQDENIPMHRHALAPDSNLKGSTEIPIK